MEKERLRGKRLREGKRGETKERRRKKRREETASVMKEGVDRRKGKWKGEE